MLIVGGREAENHAVAVRDRIEGDLGAMPVVEAIEKLQAENIKYGRLKSLIKKINNTFKIAKITFTIAKEVFLSPLVPPKTRLIGAPLKGGL